MKKMILLVAVLWFLLISGCSKKPAFNDLGGSSLINGIAVLYDTMGGDFGFKAMGGITIYIRDSADTAAYLYSVKTDKLGQFSFSGFDSTAKYVIYGAYDTGGIRYYGTLPYRGQGGGFISGKDTLVFSIDTLTQNGIFCEAYDSVGGKLPGASIFISSSKLLWNAADTAVNAYDIKSDGFGRLLKMNIDYGEYYLQGYFYLPDHTYWTGTGSVKVMQQGIGKLALILK